MIKDGTAAKFQMLVWHHETDVTEESAHMHRLPLWFYYAFCSCKYLFLSTAVDLLHWNVWRATVEYRAIFNCLYSTGSEGTNFTWICFHIKRICGNVSCSWLLKFVNDNSCRINTYVHWETSLVSCGIIICTCDTHDSTTTDLWCFHVHGSNIYFTQQFTWHSDY